jgi:hypothetical protein
MVIRHLGLTTEDAVRQLCTGNGQPSAFADSIQDRSVISVVDMALATLLLAG